MALIASKISGRQQDTSTASSKGEGWQTTGASANELRAIYQS
jgi:hypothetical protein